MAIFTNQATLSFGNSTVSSNIVTGEILDALTVEKTALRDSYRPGDAVTYAVTLRNTGDAALTGLTLSDDLGAYSPAEGTAAVTPLTYVEGSLRLFVNGVQQAAPTPAGTGTLEIPGLTLPGSANAMLLYQAEANEYAPLREDGQIVNTVTVTGAALQDPVTDSAVVAADTTPVLSISKALSPGAVPGNGTLTYTFVLENRGLREAAGDTMLTDVFDPILQNVSVTFNGAAWAVGTDYQYDETTGVFTTVPGRLVIPAAETRQADDGAWQVLPGTAVLTITGSL